MRSLCIKVRTVLIHSPIKKNGFPLFQHQGLRSTPRWPRSSQCSKVTVHYSVDYILPTKIAMETQMNSSSMRTFLSHLHCPSMGKCAFARSQTLEVCLEPQDHHQILQRRMMFKSLMEQPLMAKRNLLGYAMPLGTSATFSEYTVLRKCLFRFL